ncbi:hypothetical protein [Methylobacterium sp. 17Sr1-1]|uniref:hypothetical protein n=1 Tax=Methylobacterium sp. 17Sr1-1 TaxID=2202826 RepID=UPI000D6EED22|nr:hypothetical protein [Methylobacterium sp. 17Sr1-1]AWN54500.1 hypothetical protein DK412_25205 [Methylobacterium sp. 17Sr1-1]
MEHASRNALSRPLAASLLAAMLACPALAQPAPTDPGPGVPAGWSQEVRMVVALAVPEEKAQALLPVGWTVNPAQQGPGRGANLSVVFREQLAATGPDGKPAGAEERAAVLAVPARRGDETGFVIVRTFADARSGPGYYKVGVPAAVTLERRGSATTLAGQAEEAWSVTAESGERLSLRVAYARGTPVRAQPTALNLSAADPRVRRTYRVDQGVDPVLSRPAGVDRTTALSFAASGGTLAPIFDGREQVVAVLSLPWYARQMFAPAAID